MKLPFFCTLRVNFTKAVQAWTQDVGTKLWQQQQQLSRVHSLAHCLNETGCKNLIALFLTFTVLLIWHKINTRYIFLSSCKKLINKKLCEIFTIITLGTTITCNTRILTLHFRNSLKFTTLIYILRQFIPYLQLNSNS